MIVVKHLQMNQILAVSVQLYGCTTWSLTKHVKKKLDRNFKRMLHALLNEPMTTYLASHKPFK